MTYITKRNRKLIPKVQKINKIKICVTADLEILEYSVNAKYVMSQTHF